MTDWYHFEHATTNLCVCLCVSVSRVGAWTLLVMTFLCLFSRVLWNFEILWIHTDWCLSLDSLLLYSSQYPLYPVYIWYGYWLQLEHELDWLLCLYDNWTGIPVPWTVFWEKNYWLIPFWTCHNKLFLTYLCVNFNDENDNSEKFRLHDFKMSRAENIEKTRTEIWWLSCNPRALLKSNPFYY